MRPGPREPLARYREGLWDLFTGLQRPGRRSPGSAGDRVARHWGSGGRSRDEMDVEMSLDTGARAPADVDPDLMKARADLGLDHPFGLLEQECRLVELLGSEISQLGGVTVRDDHQVARRVGVQVQDDEGVPAPVDHEVLFAFFAEDLLAEDALTGILDALDVRHPPGGPEGFQPSSLLSGCARGRREGYHVDMRGGNDRE